ncbi:MAG: creatininase family protein [Bacteroidales bacterium]|nr:MAG: creatininase family protein [Bacteroidales bacterium]
MKTKPYLLSETNWKTVKENEYEIAILPWGATEAHNYHLPYGIDNIQSDFISAEAARICWEQGIKTIVLPCVPYGVNTGQLDIPYTINLNPSTHFCVLEDIIESLHYQGTEKLVIVNGHGGNDFKQIIRELQPRYPEIFICTLDWWKILDNSAYFAEPGDHGGEMETCNLLFIDPDLMLPVEQAGNGKAKKFKLKGIREGWVWAQREWTKISEDTGVGNPVKATSEKGEKFLRDVTHKIAEFLVELAHADLDDLYE